MSKKPGRKSDYDPKYCEMLIDHMSEGLSFEAFAGVLRKSKQTLYTWAEEHPEFAEAKEIAFSACRLHWEKIGRDYVITETESESDGETRSSSSKSLNASAWIFNMKNRFQWRDKQPEEVEKTTINLSGLSDEELKKIAKEAMPELFEKAGKK